MSTLQLSDVEAASWGVSLEPDTRELRAWLDGQEPPPREEERCSFFEAGDGRPIFERIDAYGEDLLRLRRVIVGR